MKSGLRHQCSVRLNQAAYKVIKTSGQRPADWLRQAVEWRIEHERPAVSALTALEQRIGKLERQGTDNHQGILQLQQSDAIAQAALGDLRKTLTAVLNHQVEFHAMLERIDAHFGDTLNQVGPALLSALSQMLKAPEEPPRRLIPPAPPRTRL